MNGKVYLVGAGPGDPGLLTVRGAYLLSQADVVVHDYLASRELLDLAPESCRFVYVGKSGSDHTKTQDQINELLVSEAKKNLTVVRLKGGDPYIFGRGGEEALFLVENGIEFEEVPGISSTVAAAAMAGIPLTHRKLSSQAVLMTGHERPDKKDSAHDWEALARIGTLVAVMGRESLDHICEKLIQAGKSPDIPAAMIQWGTTTRQKTVTGTLKTLFSEVNKSGLTAPALLVVGEVVSLREKLNWFENRPLWGRKIMVTRSRNQAGKLSAQLRELGAEVWERPVIRIREISPNPELDRILANISDYKWLVLTSPNGAEIFMKALLAKGLDSRALFGLRIAVMGEGTARELLPFGLVPDLIPPSFVAESLLEELIKKEPAKVLLARADKARDILPEGLKKGGFLVSEVSLYHTELGGELEPLEVPDLVTLTSASTAEGLAALVPQKERGLFKAASIGPITTKAARDYGFSVVTESLKATIPDLARNIRLYFEKEAL